MIARIGIAFFLLPAIFFSTPTVADDTGLKLDAELAALHKQSGFPGFAVAITDRERTLYAAGFGLADRERSKPFTAQTVLNIGSVSKTFIGVALLQAVERGTIDLDADINTYLPYPVRNPRHPKTAITLRHLATHSSGILDREAIYEKAYSSGETPSMILGTYLSEYLSPKGKWLSKKNFSKAAPGKAYDYSNIGAALAAHVLEQVVGQGFDFWTTANILEPLGMNDSGWSYATADREAHAQLYEGKKALARYTLVTYPDGGLRTSVNSLARYVTTVANGGALGSTRILKTASTDAMLADQFPEGAISGMGKHQKSSGIFWSLQKNGGIGHNGGDPGITTFISVDPDTGRGRVFITNTSMESRELADSFKAVWEVLKAAGFEATPQMLKAR